MRYETAGDPMSNLKWTRKTTQKIADELAVIDINERDSSLIKPVAKNVISILLLLLWTLFMII